MTFDRSKTRTSRPAKFDVETLGERIVPAHLGVVAAGGLVHLSLIEKLESRTPINVYRHPHPIIAPHPVTFDFTDSPTQSPRPGKLHKNTPIIATDPVSFSVMNAPTRSPLPGRLPKINPIIATNPVSFNAINSPVISPLPGRLPINKPIIATNPVTFTAITAPKLPDPTVFPDNLSQSLFTIYNQYEQNPAGFTGVTSSTDGAGLVVVQADKVGVTVHDGNPSEFQGLMSELKQAGLTNVVSNALSGTVTGILPIAELATIANYSNNLSVNPEMVAIER